MIPRRPKRLPSELDELNRERQAMEAAMLAEAEAEALFEYGDGSGAGVIVTARENWHPGIVGLLASRLKDRFRRPAFAIASIRRQGHRLGPLDQRLRHGPHGAGGRGGRTAGWVRGGGTPWLRALTVERANLGKLRTFLRRRAAKTVNEWSRAAFSKSTAPSARSGATVQLVDQLEQAGALRGPPNRSDLAVPAHRLRDVRLVGTSHVKITLEAMDGSRLDSALHSVPQRRPWGRCC